MFHHLLLAFVALSMLLRISPSFADEHLSREELDSLSLEEYLKPVPPKTIEEAMAAFEIIEGFSLELVASEPLVVDPVAAAIDENGLLYVAELLDYPYKPKEGEKPLGRIRLLEDTDDDGVYDESHIFTDGLLWAAGIACWKGGIFATAPPDIWYFKDTDGDGEADGRDKAYTGFGTDGAQYTLNNLVWGLDHKIYASVAGNGGEVVRVGDASSEAVSLNRRDVRFDPVGGKLEAIGGGVQFGNTFDDWGNRFLCSQDSPLHHVVFPLRYLERNPDLSGFSPVHEITKENTPIYRSSPLERWRIVRSSMRVASNRGGLGDSGVSHHVLDGVAGTTIYRGGAFPKEFYGNAISGDAQNNLVHRRILEPEGVTFTSRRADEGTEFIRSTDNWFRPVNFLNAPDGTLLMLDLHREILEAVHIPYDVVKHLDLTRGRDRGRIYRIQPTGCLHSSQPHLGDAATLELVSLLEHPNSWQRETAHRLLFERQDPGAIEPLRRSLRRSESPQARLHALWSLEGLSQLTESDLWAALSDPHEVLREHAVLLSEGQADGSRRLFEKVLTLSKDPSPRVRRQVAFTLGETRDVRALEGLATIALADSGDTWIQRAILSSASPNPSRLLESILLKGPETGAGPHPDLIHTLARMAGKESKPSKVDSVLSLAANFPSERIRLDLTVNVFLGIGEGLADSNSDYESLLPELSADTRVVYETLLEKALETLEEDDPEQIGRAVRISAYGSFDRVRGPLTAVLNRTLPGPVQIAAIRALERFGDERVNPILLDSWNSLAPPARGEALETLMKRTEGIHAILRAIESGRILPTEVDAGRRARLVRHENPEIAEIAGELLDLDENISRQEVIDRFMGALELEGDSKHGQEIHKKLCLVCHRIGDEGADIGPNMALSERPPEDLLIHILDPNREVDPAYVQYLVEDFEGNTYTGILKAENAHSVTLGRDDTTETIARNNIKEMRSGGLSMMPEGLEQGLSLQDMADLIAFLASVRYDLGTPGDSYPEGYYPERPDR
jgi:putative membrane-bound dehydrogenase-like protein